MSGTVQMRKFSPIDSVSYKFKGTYYLINICALLAFVGVIIKVVFSSLKIGDEQGPAFATLVGYVFTTVALLGLLMGVVSYYFKVMNTPSVIVYIQVFFRLSD